MEKSSGVDIDVVLFMVWPGDLLRAVASLADLCSALDKSMDGRDLQAV
jgi:hypothetical protein